MGERGQCPKLAWRAPKGASLFFAERRGASSFLCLYKLGVRTLATTTAEAATTGGSNNSVNSPFVEDACGQDVGCVGEVLHGGRGNFSGSHTRFHLSAGDFSPMVFLVSFSVGHDKWAAAARHCLLPASPSVHVGLYSLPPLPPFVVASRKKTGATAKLEADSILFGLREQLAMSKSNVFWWDNHNNFSSFREVSHPQCIFTPEIGC